MNEIFVKSLALSKNFAHNVKKKIDLDYPYLKNKICLALVGTGSECYGFDDEISTDHDYSTRCQLFLARADYVKYKDVLEDYCTTRFENKVIIECIEDFYAKFTSFEQAPQTLEEYRQIPDNFLSTATNGEVFFDELGLFSKIRKDLLKYYPDDLVYKMLSYHLNHIAQSGQYNYPRMLKRRDNIACLLSLSLFAQNYMQVVHILNGQYMPFYKWSAQSVKDLKLLGEYTYTSLNLLISSEDEDKIDIINAMCLKLVETLNTMKITKTKVDFLTYQADEVTQNIQDEELRQEDNWSI